MFLMRCSTIKFNTLLYTSLFNSKNLVLPLSLSHPRIQHQPSNELLPKHASNNERYQNPLEIREREQDYPPPHKEKTASAKGPQNSKLGIPNEARLNVPHQSQAELCPLFSVFSSAYCSSPTTKPQSTKLTSDTIHTADPSTNKAPSSKM